ncbi:hypothetical protein [Micrococcus lylae]|uniref:hypothetical protein n=1 Tax=Micrococcus lylae TaxID=1273 RepID=UPI00117F8540|nr:hypothetical protein [Micrococcus lylae]
MSRATVLVATDWMEAALARVCNVAVERGSVTADDLRDFDQPEHHNSIGRVFTLARQRGHLTPVGYGLARAKSRHRGVVRLWAPTPALMQAGGL